MLTSTLSDSSPSQQTRGNNNAILRAIEPQRVFSAFETLLATPRNSREEDGALQMVEQWAGENSFSYARDEKGNRAISIPGRGKGVSSPVVILQGHIDMVCVKRDGVNHNFSTDPIPIVRTEISMQGRVDDVIQGNGTTLGADDGIGIALGMAAAVDPSIGDAPPIILLITVEEEIGLVGAQMLDPELTRGAKILLNLDSGTHAGVTIGSAGALDRRFFLKIGRGIQTELEPIILTISDYLSGHSANDTILEHRLNALGALLDVVTHLAQKYDRLKLSEINGGEKPNITPANATATIWVPRDKRALISRYASSLDPFQALKTTSAIGNGEPLYTVQVPPRWEDLLIPWSRSDTQSVLTKLRSIPYGIRDGAPPSIVTSNNLAVVQTLEDGISIRCLARSSVPGAAEEVLRETSSILGDDAITTQLGAFPIWEPTGSSYLVGHAERIAKELGETLKVRVTHGGLEVALILDAMGEGATGISFGPQIYDEHKPGESVSIPSIGYTYEFLKKMLAALCE